MKYVVVALAAAAVVADSGCRTRKFNRQEKLVGQAEGITTSELSPTSRFALEAAMGNNAEVDTGYLAWQKGSSPEVRQFGLRMVSDHADLNSMLAGAAQRLRIPLSDQVTPEQRATFERLSALSGPEFDRAYMTEMVRDHQEDLEKYKFQAVAAVDPYMQEYARRALPIIESHLESARAIQQRLGAPPRPPGGGGGGSPERI